MAAPESRRILRMGVIQNGAIIEERLFRKIEPISVGTHFKNTFSITTPRAPQAFTFFDVMGGRYVLNFIDSMEGRLSVGGTVHSLQSLKQHKKAVNRGKHWSIPLDERSRGKIVVGDVIFLFQFVTPPPAKLTPQLPIALRGGPLTFLNNTVELTGTFGIALLFSLVVQVGFVTYLVLEVPPPPRPVGIADLPDEIRMILTEMEEPPSTDMADQTITEDGEIVAESAVEDPALAEEALEEPEVEEERSSRGDPGDSEPIERTREEEIRLARSQVRDEAFWGSLAGPTDGGVGDAMNSIFNTTDRSVSQVLARQQARGEGGLGGATTSAVVGGEGDGGGGGDVVNVELAPSRTRERAENVESSDERERVRVQANIRQSRSQTAGSGHLDRDTLDAELRRRVRDIRRCYERVLPEEPDLGGRVVLQFSIDQGGRVSDVRLVENEVGDRVGDCIESRVRRWRFDAPDGGTVTVRKTYILEPAD